MLPNELSRLDDIRLSKEMWITKVKANVIDLRTYSLANMKEGLKKINWVIHDMRLSSNHPMTRFFVQEPIKAGPEALIKFKVRSRPIINNTDLVSSSIYMALESHVCQLGSLLVPASDNLMALDKYLRMRVNFGSLDVRQKKKGIGEEFTYDKFADVIKVYSLRGGASLNPQYANSQTDIMRPVTDPHTDCRITPKPKSQFRRSQTLRRASWMKATIYIMVVTSPSSLIKVNFTARLWLQVMTYGLGCSV